MTAAERANARAEVLLQCKNALAAVVLTCAMPMDGDLNRLRKIRAQEHLLEGLTLILCGVHELIEAENAADALVPADDALEALGVFQEALARAKVLDAQGDADRPARRLALVVDNEKGKR